MLSPVVATHKSHSKPAPEALHVIDHLGECANVADSDIDLVRQKYTQSRRPLLAPLVAVASVVSIAAGQGHVAISIVRPFGQRPDNLPALLYFHGGGWTLGNFTIYEPFCRKLANTTGCAIVWVDYRLAPENPFPAAYLDARGAYRWVSTNALTLGIDPTRIGVAGDGAGGNLAAVLCLDERDSWSGRLPWVQVLIYPCLDMTACLPSHKLFAVGYGLTAQVFRWYRQNYAGGITKLGQWQLSPLFAWDVKGLPPTIILYAGFDIFCDDAAAYSARLAKAEVPLQELYFPDMIHNFITLGGAISAANSAINRIAAALQNLAPLDSKNRTCRLVHG